jgi:hypothetical protein
LADATLTPRDWNRLQYISQGSIPAGKIWQTRDGRGSVYPGTVAGAATDTLTLYGSGQPNVVANSAVNILDGGPVYWDRTNGYATFKRVGANRGFFLGSAVGDSLLAASMTVNENIAPRYDVDLERDPWTTAVIGTQAAGGLGPPGLRGGALDFLLTSTNEAQKVDALSDDGIITGSKGIFEAAVKVINGGASTHAKFYIGLANATHATDPTAVAEYIYFEIDSNVTKINAQSSDGTTTVAKTDTTKTYTTNTRFELWIDVRDPTNVKLYVDGVRVLSGTTFSLAAGASNLFLLAWLGKTASTDTAEFQVDWCRVRTAEQSANGV